jgi:hypothetical protein
VRVPIASNAGYLGAVRRDEAVPLAHGFSTALLDETARADLVIVVTAVVRARLRSRKSEGSAEKHQWHA